MLTLILKQAETALAAGRLEEACDIAQRPEVRAHRRGQALLDRLLAALLARAREHLDRGHVPEALTDCRRVVALGGRGPEAADLQRDVCRAVDQGRAAQRCTEQQLAEARAHVARGRLTLGQEVLGGLGTGTPGADGLDREAQAQRREREHVCAALEQALAQGDVEQALDSLLRDGEVLRAAHGTGRSLVRRVKAEAAAHLRHLLSQGRVRRVESTVTRLAAVIEPGDPLDEVAAGLAVCARAREALDRGQLVEALRGLHQADALLPGIDWIREALDRTRDAAERVEAVASGPLSLLEGPMQGPAESPTPARPEPPRRVTPAVPPDESPAWPTPGPAVLQVDGVGSYLLYTASELTVGPISAAARPTLGLLADPSLPTVTFRRHDEDYFVESPRPVALDGRPVKRALLADGQRVALSDRCRIRFNRPNAASSTATLAFSGMRLPRGDLRYAIMMDDSLLIGPGTHHHIRTADPIAPVTLTYRAGRLRGPDGTVLPWDRTTSVGELRLTLTRAD